MNPPQNQYVKPPSVAAHQTIGSTNAMIAIGRTSTAYSRSSQLCTWTIGAVIRRNQPAPSGARA